MEKYENDIDGILTAAHELQETVYTTYRQAQKRLALRIRPYFLLQKPEQKT